MLSKIENLGRFHIDRVIVLVLIVASLVWIRK